MDPLSRIFPLLRMDTTRPARLDTGGAWALRFPGSPHVRFGAAVAGTSWLTVAGQRHPLKLQAGDGYLLTRGQAYTVGSEPDRLGEDGVALFRQQGGHVQYGPLRGVSLVSGRFTFDELGSELLLQVLPAIVHLEAGGDSAAVLRAAIDLLDHETREPRFGASLVTHHVAQIMLVQALRMVAASESVRPMGWLAALADPRIGAALQLMHEQIARRWTVEELARIAGMSRSVFAQRFKQLVGSAPLDYLLHLRMRVAGNTLRAGKRSVSAVALEIGYRSESAFSTAFKRIMGAPPKDFRAAHT
jgi:AraC-like DNA-binding protein